MMRVPCARRRNTNGGSAFSPSGISGLFERWIAEQAYMTMDGSNNVSSWAGAYAGRTLAQATSGQQPNWTSALAAANNKPAVQFTAASSDELNDAGTTAYDFAVRTDTGDGCTWTGCFYTSDASGNPLAGIGADGTKARWIVYSRSGSSYSIEHVNAAGTTSAYTAFGPAASGVVWFAFARSQGTGTGRFACAGSLLGGVTTPSVTDVAGVSANTVTPTRGVRLGRSGGSYGSSSWLELSLYTRPLTAGEMAQLGTYYVSTYGANP